MTDLRTPQMHRHLHGDLAFYQDSALAHTGITLAFSERGGGVSSPPYDSLNLGLQVQDNPDAVASNRARLMDALNLPQSAHERLVSAQQVHGTRIASVTKDCPPDTFTAPLPATDALITALANTPLLLCFADCVPVLLYATEPRPVVAVVHSGWRGTAAEIAGVTVRAMSEGYGCDPAQITAYIGPYIGPESFEVSAEVWLQFKAKFARLDARFSSGKDGSRKVQFDLGQAVVASLEKAGVNRGRIANLEMSTVTCSDRFFSYRASQGVCGRHGAIACIA
jgi:YfiH family protein